MATAWKIKHKLLCCSTLFSFSYFFDIFNVPRKRFLDKPALVVELKWDKSARGAISQIKEKDYAGKLVHYAGEILLVGINYDKKQKKHECVIEQYTCK